MATTSSSASHEVASQTPTIGRGASVLHVVRAGEVIGALRLEDRVRLGDPVRSISHDGAGVTLHTPQGAHRASPSVQDRDAEPGAVRHEHGLRHAPG